MNNNTALLCQGVTAESSSFAPPRISAGFRLSMHHNHTSIQTPTASRQRQHQQQQNSTRPFPRIVLGIFSELQVPSERQRRHLVRNTYLAFDRVHSTQTPNRVCSLQEFTSPKTPAVMKDECQLVYTFVLSAQDSNTKQLVSINESFDKSTNPNHPQSSFVADSSLMDNHEQDVIYLNVQETDRVGKLLAWFRYCASLQISIELDYIVKTDAQIAILPTVFWKNNLFQKQPQQRVYGGIPESKTDCMSKEKCPSLQGDYLMRRFVLLSNDLVQELFSTSTTTTTTTTTNVIQFAPKETPDVVISNLLQGKQFQNVSLNGIVKKTSASGKVGDYLQVWDKYKDNLVSYQADSAEVAWVTSHTTSHPPNKDSSNKPPTLVLGIFSMDSPDEYERRAMIRKTYLAQYSKSVQNNNSSNNNLICPLYLLVKHFNNSTTRQGNNCRLAYTFVMGGNPKGPTELVRYNDSYPLMLPNQGDENDLVYLNIRENMKEGKSQTWLAYAAKYLLEHHGIYFDFIGKTDTDTLLYPSAFLSQVLDQLPTFPDNTRVYGGDYRIRPSTNSLNLGPVYMGGHLYYMSPDLARFIISENCTRSEVAVFSEDQSIGNFVHLHPFPIRRVRMTTTVFEHPVKKVNRFPTLWRNFLDKYNKKK